MANMTPQNVRPHWVEVEIEGQRTVLQGGPKSRGKGIKVTIYQRDRGRVRPMLTVVGKSDSERASLSVNDPTNGELLPPKVTALD
jgi:hypothetical protein